jgi:hypothetical protein
MGRTNILLIMSDEHDPAVTACYGHPTVSTPNPDRPAQERILLENAYTNHGQRRYQAACDLEKLTTVPTFTLLV